MNKVVEELKNMDMFFVGTCDGNQPRVRPFSSITEFEGAPYICCGNQKEVFKQMMANPKIEICGMAKNGNWIRVEAIVERDERIEAQEAMLADPFEVFKLTNIKALRYNFYSAPEEIK